MNSAAQSIELQIYAAASLTDSFTELAAVYNEINQHEIVLNFAGSSTLAAQIRQGAPADIFASANLEQMQILVDEELVVAKDISTFARNTLVLMTPIDNPVGIESVRDLVQPDTLLIVAAPTVPIREYTNILLDNLDNLYEFEISDQIRANIVSEESNVRQIVAKIILGEADAAFVYRTDVTPDIAAFVTLIELPAGISPLADYVIAPLAETAYPDEAQGFIDFVLSNTGQEILERWGFCRMDNEPVAEVTAEVEGTSKNDTSEWATTRDRPYNAENSLGTEASCA